MPIEFVAGDLFDNVHHAKAFAHGCNCQGSMGAGVAIGFRERYPEMFEQYRARCKAKPREFNLGDVWLWKADDKPWVFNLGTQEGVWRARASYEAIETALKTMRKVADAEGIDSIAVPRIGVGYGGLSWKKVKEIIERVLSDWKGRLIVYETFVPATTASAATAAPAKAKSKKKNSVSQFRTRAMTIVCTDVQRSAEFYEKVLGATRLPTDVGHWYRLGSLEISLLPNAAKPSPADFPTHAMMMLWLEVDELSRAAKQFADHGVKVTDEGDGQFMTVADPDGLLIEVWQAEPAE